METCAAVDGAGLGMEDRPARGDDLVGVSGCFCAFADTGTLMLLFGPSRTADIEQTVTMGAHGPYRVHIILVG